MSLFASGSVSTLLFVLAVFNERANGDDVDSDLLGFKTWIESEATLPSTCRSSFTVYDESFNKDCIYIVGGTSCSTQVSCYNVTSNTLYVYDDSLLDSGSQYSTTNQNQLACAFINGTIYFDNSFGSIQSYDIATKTQTYLTTINKALYPCMTKHPSDDNILLIQGQYNSSTYNNFFMYDIANNSYIQGPSLFSGRSEPTCIANNGYFYVFGGNSAYIERIYVGNNDSNSVNSKNIIENVVNYGYWEVLSQKFENIDGSTFDSSSIIRHFSIVSYLNYIILLNGLDTNVADAGQEIFVLDTDTLTLQFFGDYPLKVYTSSAVLANDRIFVFGGRDPEANVVYDTIFYTDQVSAHETDFPTSFPSSMPSVIPSLIPSLVPSSMPSSNPTTIPTVLPSYVPSVEPSTMPSKIPTNNPTYNPTNNPTSVPNMATAVSKSPSNMPSSSPIAVDNDASTSNGNSSAISDSSIIAIVIGSVIAVCCIVLLCIFVVGSYMYREHKRDWIKNAMVSNDQINALSQEIELLKQDQKKEVSQLPESDKKMSEQEIAVSVINELEGTKAEKEKMKGEIIQNDVLADDDDVDVDPLFVQSDESTKPTSLGES